MPGVGGHVFNYRELTQRLGDDQPVYGFQPRGLDGKAKPHATIEATAEEYVREICAMHADGPYHLAGYSLGGLVVIEMAKQLAAAGLKVGVLAMLDAHAPGHPRRRSFAGRLAAHARNFWAKSWREKISYIGQRLLNQVRRDPSPVDTWLSGAAELSPEMHIVIEAQMAAMERYRPDPYEGRVMLFRSRDKEAWSEMYVPDYTLGWGEVVQGGLDLHWVSGGHLEIFQGEALETIAHQLSRALRQQ
ncbi:MAG: alpha/beta fold hydrolase [Gemmataceae bacterium]